MRLIAFSLEGYRRFVEKTSVKLHGDLIAFVGPNEAGKSSLLRAMTHLNDKNALQPNEHPRRTGLQPKLMWHFQLDDEDRIALANILDASVVERAIVTKKADGSRSWEVEPRRPMRDRAHRLEAAATMSLHRDGGDFRAADEDETHEFNLGDYDRARETLLADVETFAPANLAGLRDVARRIRLVEPPEDEDDPEEDAVNVGDFGDGWPAYREALAASLDAVASEEETTAPFQAVLNALSQRLPKILLFDDEDRDLASQYDLAEVADSPPAALRHLASLAQLDLPALRDEAIGQAIADLATRRNAANRVLLDAFDKSWNQQGIAVQIDVHGTILHVQATTPEDSGLSDISERSDGMRWFAALLAYAHGWEDQPILLVDEIEKHLHYDAQSDLVGVLAKQRFTSKVIYTTHSFGCLPFDLGTGVRIVQPIDAATSKLENGFWKNGSGFSPLLVSMGAAAVSFTPTRHALIAEGAGDAILLPTLLRHAADAEYLRFQIAPGLSSVAASAVGSLEAEAGRVGFIVDGDGGGLAIRDKLMAAGVEGARVIVLQSDDEELETEDLVDPEVYLNAVNEELRCWQEVSTPLSLAELTTSLRTKAVAEWCTSRGLVAPDKAAVAQRVIDQSPERPVHSAARRPLLIKLLSDVHAILGLGPAKA